MEDDEKERSALATQYHELKEKRHANLNKGFEEFINSLKVRAVLKSSQICEDEAYKSGEYDEIDEKVCIRSRERVIQNSLIGILPDLTQQAVNFEQCMLECQKNNITYVVANQSCQTVYTKNFNKATANIVAKLEALNII